MNRSIHYDASRLGYEVTNCIDDWLLHNGLITSACYEIEISISRTTTIETERPLKFVKMLVCSVAMDICEL